MHTASRGIDSGSLVTHLLSVCLLSDALLRDVKSVCLPKPFIPAVREKQRAAFMSCCMKRLGCGEIAQDGVY